MHCGGSYKCCDLVQSNEKGRKVASLIFSRDLSAMKDFQSRLKFKATFVWSSEGFQPGMNLFPLRVRRGEV